ncbi:MAG: hypothetical protein O2971_02550 [Proteobacteria bacterium]|nr:hypothetical protein [Pseudomonadota bacterium]
MEHQEFLRTVAEVAITLTGFTGIVAAFKMGNITWTKRTLTQFGVLVRSTVSACLMSFVPYLLSLFIESENVVWQIATGVLGSIITINLFWFKGQFAGLQVASIHKALYVGGLLVIAALLLSAIGVLQANKIFLIGIFWQLFIGVNNFVLLVRSDIQQLQSDEEIAGAEESN